MPKEERPTEPLPPASSERVSLLVMSKTGVFSCALPEVGEVVLGRSPECDIHIEDGRVSRRHALLRVGPTFELEDLGGLNGTVVGERRLASRETIRLAIGDMVTLGSTVLVLQNTPAHATPLRVWSHGAFEERLAEVWGQAQRERRPFALVQIEFSGRSLSSSHDSTSRDTNLAKDVALADRFEATLRAILRPQDLVASHAAGIYEILLPETPPEIADSLAARLRLRLKDGGFRAEVGLACYPREARTLSSLMARARAAVHGAEDEGPRGSQLDSSAKDRIDRIASGTINVLILGETGVGKEVMARSLHERSPRAREPLVCLNCAAFSEALLESELFGHERGAFTGAVQAKLGLLESAQRGTVFLDEVGEMPLSLQAKLLRVIEQREVLRVGALKPRPIDVRFIAATNRELEAEITAGRFRQDLYFRLNGITVVIPPLRERVDEIESLARAFIAHASEGSGRAPPGLSPQGLALLKRYRWPGNIRELRNVIERAVLFCTSDTITLEHLPFEKMGPVVPLGAASSTKQPRTPVWDPEQTQRLSGPAIEALTGGGASDRDRVVAALEQCRGNQTQAARLLGISRRTLVSRLTEYDLPRPRKKPGDDP